MLKKAMQQRGVLQILQVGTKLVYNQAKIETILFNHQNICNNVHGPIKNQFK